MKLMIPMKRLITVLLAIVLVFLTTACGNTPNAGKELQHKFPEYYDLDTFKGLEVYVWQTAENTYYCGVLPGTNRMKTDDEISDLAANGATVEEMKAILSSYHISAQSIDIIPCRPSASDYTYQIDEAYIRNIIALFEK